MTNLDRGTLRFSRGLLRFLIAVNWLYGAGILVMFAWSFFQADTLYRALGISDYALSEQARRSIQAIMVIGMVCVPVMNIALSRLLDIVETVRQADPFVVQNAARLRAIAWCAVFLTCAEFVIGVIAKVVAESVLNFKIDLDFSFTPWLAILLLFVLARVFELGAKMREDLHGTV